MLPSLYHKLLTAPYIKINKSLKKSRKARENITAMAPQNVENRRYVVSPQNQTIIQPQHQVVYAQPSQQYIYSQTGPNGELLLPESGQVLMAT